MSLLQIRIFLKARIFSMLFDGIKHENDNYSRAEMISVNATMFGEVVSERELKKRAKLWYMADHLVNAHILDVLSKSPYIEVRESVAANSHTSSKTLERLSHDDDFEVRETAVLNTNLPLSKVKELLNDEHEMVRDAVKYRLKSK